MRIPTKPSGVVPVVLALLLLLVSHSISARTAPEQICDHVARIASQQTGVPLSVLQAITRTETGRKKGGRFTPWPWTVNMEGRGVWFDTLDEARAYVFREFKRGARSFDVGCFQLNYKWHHQGFTSIDQMFDPQANALYAAGFLKDLYAEKGNWADAAGAYHSRTPKHANRYKAIFEKHRRRTGASETIQTAAATVPLTVPGQPPVRVRVNRYPLLRPAAEGAGTRLGSLVPAGPGTSPGGFLRLDRPANDGLIGG